MRWALILVYLRPMMLEQMHLQQRPPLLLPLLLRRTTPPLLLLLLLHAVRQQHPDGGHRGTSMLVTQRQMILCRRLVQQP